MAAIGLAVAATILFEYDLSSHKKERIHAGMGTHTHTHTLAVWTAEDFASAGAAVPTKKRKHKRVSMGYIIWP